MTSYNKLLFRMFANIKLNIILSKKKSEKKDFLLPVFFEAR